MLMMFFSPGDYGPNEYGDHPKGEGNERYDASGYDFKTGKTIAAGEHDSM